MIVLDTNIVSETMTRRPNPLVVDFLRQSEREVFAITTLTLFELRLGIEILPQSAERSRLWILFEGYEAGALGSPLPLDPESAGLAAVFRAERRRKGRPTSVPDSLIAGIALRHGAALATRNIRDFEDSGLALIDPWQAVP
ncbi:ribonuclease VapC [Aureimonas endophytica]|uniref:Ribonuclease VapC n=1 Tax=Aureimonas endophytica TaxID=2027858 RepID=A0A917EBY1_9HYPH|nr:type II toxin-antitoxin system VapC family toxin [Aureimonas endophytica]GGE22181.1 ribonuclease VapC [Aureimonas endophytica]